MKKTKTLTVTAILIAVSSIATASTPPLLNLISQTHLTLTSTAITTSILLTSPAYIYLLIKKD